MNKQRKAVLWQKLTSTSTLVICGILLLSATPLVHADSFQQQIDNLNTQNSQTQSTVSQLQVQATSYQDEINQLQTQIDDIQAGINANEAKQAELQQQITADEANIVLQKQYLSADIKAMYVGGQMTTIEELATSQNLSDFVDAQTYQQAVEAKLQSTLSEINTLEAQQKSEQTQIAQLLTAENSQEAQVTTDQNQQNSLLSYNQQQQDQYTQQIAQNNSQISVLEAEQAAANAAEARSVDVSSGNGSGACARSAPNDQGTGPVAGNGILPANYPDTWCNASEDSIYDANGILNRECTSFAYWYFVDIEGNKNFQVSGNAGWWWETSSYPVSTTPEVGAIGVEPSSATSTATVPSLHDSPTGHVMIVVALSGQTYDGNTPPSGYVMVASMNERETGQFEYDNWPTADLWYINPS